MSPHIGGTIFLLICGVLELILLPLMGLLTPHYTHDVNKRISCTKLRPAYTLKLITTRSTRIQGLILDTTKSNLWMFFFFKGCLDLECLQKSQSNLPFFFDGQLKNKTLNI